MNDIKKLEERIAQLTELVKTGTETVESLKETLKTVEEERDRLVDQRREQEPKFERIKKNEKYYYIDFGQYRGGVCYFVEREIEEGHPLDEALYNRNNYFHTEQRAQEVADKFNFLLKLERLHDIYCPDYVPDWDNENEYKYSVHYDNERKYYKVGALCVVEHKSDVVFPTTKIAQKVCDILNKELEEKI